MNSNYESLSHYTSSVPIPSEWLYQYKIHANTNLPYVFNPNARYYPDLGHKKEKYKYGTYDYYDENLVDCFTAYDTNNNSMIFRKPNEIEMYPSKQVEKALKDIKTENEGLRKNTIYIKPRSFQNNPYFSNMPSH